MTALNGTHYILNHRGFHFTYAGLCELSMWRRKMIEMAFFDKTLGDTYEFPEYTEPHEYEPESVEEPEESDCYDPRQDEVLADKVYEDGKDRRWRGLVYTREGRVNGLRED